MANFPALRRSSSALLLLAAWPRLAGALGTSRPTAAAAAAPPGGALGAARPAAAATAPAGAGSKSEAGAPGVLLRREQATQPGPPQSEAEDVPADFENSAHLELCDLRITMHVCDYFWVGDSVPMPSLANHVGVAQSTMEHVLNMTGTTLHDGAVSCPELCNTLVLHCELDPDCHVPHVSDVACYSTSDGRTHCPLPDGDVRPPKLLEVVEQANPGSAEAHPDTTPVLTGGEEATEKDFGKGIVHCGSAHLLDDSTEFKSCHQIIERLLNIFRVFPVFSGDGQTQVSDIAVDLNEGTIGKESDRELILWRAHAKAKGYVSNALDATMMSTVISQAVGDGKAQDMYGWFPVTSSHEVRQDLNRLFRDLAAGFHYIYPQNEVPHTQCTGASGPHRLAYVVKAVENFEPTRGPVCEGGLSDGFEKPCGVDGSGRLFVYLCDGFWAASEGVQVAALLHEALHHVGPGDLTWDGIRQQTAGWGQLQNIDNFQNYMADATAAMWECSDVVPCNADSCSSAVMRSRKCRYTCNQCLYYRTPGFSA